VEFREEFYSSFLLKLRGEKLKPVFGFKLNLLDDTQIKEWRLEAGVEKRFKKHYLNAKVLIQDKVNADENKFDAGITLGAEYWAWKSRSNWSSGLEILSQKAKIFFNPEYYFGPIYSWTFVELSRTKDNEKVLFLQADIGLDIELSPLICFENIHYKKENYYWRRIGIGLGLRFDNFLSLINGKIKFFFVDEEDEWNIQSGYSVVIELYSPKKLLNVLILTVV